MSFPRTKKYKKFKSMQLRIKQFKTNLSDNSIMPFGMYKGLKVSFVKETNINYYNWFIEKLK